jgi:hypothetical protein
VATAAISKPKPRTLRELINPTERQQEFFDKLAQFDFVLYEGEASGGKSYALRWWLVDFLVDCYQTLGLSSVVVGLFAEDYPVLKDRHISKIRVEMPPWLGALTRTDGGLDFKLRPEYGSGSIALRNLDDPSKYFSAEFAAIAVEELTRNPLAVFNDLRFRLRWPGIKRPKFGAGTNPGGIGHAWVKKYWITKDYPPEFKGIFCHVCRVVWKKGDKACPKCKKTDSSEEYDITSQFGRVTARASDNPYIAGEYHIRNLTLPPEMANRVAHADWDVYTGQYFPRFDVKIHVIPHAEAMARIQPWYTRSLSGDWGFDHPHCFHWHAKDENNWVITHDELWDRGVGEAEVGRRITSAEAQYHKLAKLNGFAFSWDALGKMSARSSRSQPKTTAQLICETLGPRIPRPHPNDSSAGVRLIRARLMSQVLEAGTWLISDRCAKLIEAIPSMIRDPDHPEQMLKVDWNEATIGDDPVDSAAMGLQWMIGTSVKPDAVKLEERVAAVRQQFVARAEAVKPGTDWGAQFGGERARKR